jgi:hypothetical protein
VGKEGKEGGVGGEGEEGEAGEERTIAKMLRKRRQDMNSRMGEGREGGREGGRGAVESQRMSRWYRMSSCVLFLSPLWSILFSPLVRALGVVFVCGCE